MERPDFGESDPIISSRPKEPERRPRRSTYRDQRDADGAVALTIGIVLAIGLCVLLWPIVQGIWVFTDPDVMRIMVGEGRE